jgi:hypothetical protein
MNRADGIAPQTIAVVRFFAVLGSVLLVQVIGKDEVTSSNMVKSSIRNPHGVRLCGFLLFLWKVRKRVKLQ